MAPSGGGPLSYSGRSSSAGAESYPGHSIGSPSIRESTYGIGAPSKVRTTDEKLKQVKSNLVKRGIVFGWWQHQFAIACFSLEV